MRFAHSCGVYHLFGEEATVVVTPKGIEMKTAGNLQTYRHLNQGVNLT